MTDTNSTTLRSTLAAAVKKHADDNGLSAKKGAELADVQLSRFYQVMRGEVSKISSDALVNMLGNFGYRLTAANGSGNGTEIVISLDIADKVLPEIAPPAAGYSIRTSEDTGVITADGFGLINTVEPGKPFAIVKGEIVDGKVASSEVVMSNEADFDPDYDRVVSDDE